MKDRKDVDINETWDLSLLYKTEEDYEKALYETIKKADLLAEKYEDRLDSPSKVIEALKLYEDILEASDKMGSYASFDQATDYFNQKANNRLGKLENAMAKYYSKITFLENEIKYLDQEILDELLKDDTYGVYIKKIIEEKKHTLSKNQEKLLTSLSNILSLPELSYNSAKLRDIKFDSFQVCGQKIEMDYNKFENYYDSIEDTDIRRRAHRIFYDTLGKYENVTATAYNAEVQKDKTIADLRGYNNIFTYLLRNQNVEIALYDRQIDVIMEELAPHMRRYAKLLQKIHGLDQMHFADLKIEVDPTYSSKISFEQARDYILDGISIYGKEYRTIIAKAFDQRWIDYAENKGKSTGAFCGSPYGANSFILSSFNNTMSEVITLAHELGHAGQGYYSNTNQNILNATPSLYIIEAPSTTNELIVANHLLDKAGDDKRMKRWVLSQVVSKTYYHNFVTHFIEAAYQREVYKLVEKGENLEASDFNRIFKGKLEEFWGDAVVVDDEVKRTWMRQPHYYSGLYSYTYSAGLTIGTQVALKIRKNGEKEAKKWLEVLKMGGRKTPLELAKMVDIDISTDKPLKDTIAYIGSLIDEIEQLSRDLGEIV